MCFEWDERYFRELEEEKSKMKVAEFLKNAEEATKASQDSVSPQTVNPKEQATT